MDTISSVLHGLQANIFRPLIIGYPVFSVIKGIPIYLTNC